MCSCHVYIPPIFSVFLRTFMSKAVFGACSDAYIYIHHSEMIFLLFLCMLGKILVHYLVMIQDGSCLVVSQNYSYILSIFPPCVSKHPRTVMNSTLKNTLLSGNTKNNVV